MMTLSRIRGIISRTLSMTVVLLLLLSASACGKAVLFTNEERQIIQQDSARLMRIYTIDCPEDNIILRAKSRELSLEEIASQHYTLLARRMLQTVSDSTVDGVGIAAPQVGINRRIVAVQRFDKPGEPFEVFPNIYIKAYSPDTTFEEEGCLSVPDRSGRAVRSKWVVVRYTDPQTLTLQEDTIEGFTAIIFQHEIDHLEGIIYTDSMRAKQNTVYREETEE